MAYTLLDQKSCISTVKVEIPEEKTNWLPIIGMLGIATLGIVMISKRKK